jgi:hypothetical protein
MKEGMVKDNNVDTYSSTYWEKFYYKNSKDNIIKISLPVESINDNFNSNSNIICEITDKFSKFIQLKLVGFLPHDRHQKGFGLAILEIVRLFNYFDVYFYFILLLNVVNVFIYLILITLSIYYIGSSYSITCIIINSR